MPRKQIKSPTYTLGAVTRITGAKRSQVENWVRSRAITPEGPAHGTGNRRVFIFRNLVEVAVCVELSTHSYQISELRSAMLALRLQDGGDSMLQHPTDKRQEAEMRRRFEAHRLGLSDREREEEDAKMESLNEEYVAEHREFLEGVQDDLDQHGIIKMSASEWLDSQAEEADARWRAFRNPSSRPATAKYFLIGVSDASDSLLWVVTDDVGFFLDRARASVHLVNLRVVLERLEKATDGDWWRTVKDVYAG